MPHPPKRPSRLVKDIAPRSPFHVPLDVDLPVPAEYETDTLDEREAPLESERGLSLDAFKVWNLIIRPQRRLYSEYDLGATVFLVGDLVCWRRDLCVKTRRGSKVFCSHFRPSEDSEAAGRPVVVYLHGNCGCRLEVLDYVQPLLAAGMTVFTYDAAGCGISEGDYVSLGWHERTDLAEILTELRCLTPVGPMAVWGRSMGAVTALLLDPKVASQLAGICADSPFASLREVIERFAKTGALVDCSLPGWAVDAAIAVVRSRVRALADFDIDEVAPMNFVRQHSSVPALFLHGLADNFVPVSHTRQLYEAYACPCKQLYEFNGSHNSPRGDDATRTVVNFFAALFGLAAPADDSALRLTSPGPKLLPPVQAPSPLDTETWQELEVDEELDLESDAFREVASLSKVRDVPVVRGGHGVTTRFGF